MDSTVGNPMRSTFCSRARLMVRYFRDAAVGASTCFLRRRYQASQASALA